MRVARIITRMNRGGPARTIVAIEPLLRQAGVETLLLCGPPAPGEDDLSADAERAGIRVERVRALGRRIQPARDLVALRALHRAWRSFRPDLVHTHTFKAGLLGRCRVARSGPPRVHTFHGHAFHGYLPAWGSRGLATVERWLAGRTDRIIAVSESTRRDLVERYRIAPEAKVSVLPGVVVREEARAPEGLPFPDRVPCVGCVARLTRIKAPFHFLDVAGAVLARRPDVHFLWVGDGDLREEFLGQIRARRLEERVHWIGWQRTVGPWHRRFRVEVLLSDSEGLPLSLLEAREAGVPVVATETGGTADLVSAGADGWLVPPRDVAAAAAAILEALADPEEAARRGQAAQRKDRGCYTPEAHVQGLLPLYRSVCEAS